MERLREKLRERLREKCIRAVVLFGSKARGEDTKHSDLDLLVLHEGCEEKDPVKLRRKLYAALKEALNWEVEELTVIDMELSEFMSPREITPLLLNIYWDGIVVYDATGKVQDFLTEVKRRIEASGLRRVKDGRAYYWVLPEPMREVKIL
ncbi:MAG: hypothetical protein DRJ97_08075 [Thermoprotei archaeon]|nr:MAG: hypothetical protein DRJ97_08075 [Thermoprotei archaeon]